MAQDQQDKSKSKTTEAADTDVDAKIKTAAERKEERDGEIDDVLDEIDGVLEENAEDFVRAYVQKGGE